MSCKSKRDIFHFKGERPTAINLEHVTNMCVEGKRITFFFSASSIYVDLENEDAANNVFNQILTIWAGDVLE